MYVVAEVQASCGQHLGQLFAVAEVECQVGGDDSLADDLQHLLVLSGSQVGENIVPFQLWETKRSIKSKSSTYEGFISATLQTAGDCWRPGSDAPPGPHSSTETA